MKLILLLTLTLICSTVGQTQVSQWQFDQQSLEQGLSNTYVTDIIKDSKGYIWIATHNGLNRYNGYNYLAFKHDDTNPESINSNVVRAVFEDSKDRLWAGTNQGLNYYDHAKGEFSHYYLDSTVHHLFEKTLIINQITEDSHGMLWIATTHHGVLKFDPEKRIFAKVVPVNLIDDHFYDAFVHTVLVDRNENLWMGTNGYGIIRFDINTKEMQWYSNIVHDKHPSQLSYAFNIFEDSDGNIWGGTYVGGLAKYEPKINSFRILPNPYNKDALIKNGIISIEQKDANELILGSNGGGLFFFNTQTETFTENYISDPANQNSISGDFIGEIYIDDTDIIWFGTENSGVFIYDPNIRKFELYKKTGDSENDLPGNIVNSICESENGLIWIGTENDGFASLDRKTGTYKSYKIRNSQPSRGNTFVKKIISDKTGNLWIATHMGGLAHVKQTGELIDQFSPHIQIENPNALFENDLTTLYQDLDSNLWLGGYRSIEKKVGNEFTTYCRFERDEFTRCSETIESIYPIDSENIIVGTSSDGFYFMNFKTNTFGQSFNTENSQLSNNKVYSFCLDNKNRLWIGTDKGLNKFNLKDSSITTIYQSDGLPDNRIFGILEDDSGELWISTSYGLCRYNPDKNIFHNFYKSDGLQSNVFRKGAYYKSASGELFFGGVGGFNSFFPNEIKLNPNPPAIVFTDFQVFNKSIVRGEIPSVKVLIEAAKYIELNYDESIFSFEFTALNYTLSEQNEYAYMLEGFHEDWQYIGKRRYITFTNIEPGSYTLHVKACNNDGVWNEEGASIKIKVNPPYWKTWWFRLLAILLGSFIIYLIYKWRIRSIKRQNKALEKEVIVRTKMIVEQKNEIASQKDLMEKKNMDITSSIRYSKRIQETFLPNISELESYFDTAFVFYKPKDIVSGDFYWVETSKDKEIIFIAVADCTGHGVPGAMVSVLGNSGLNQSVNELGLEKPNEILDNLNNYVKKAFDKKDSNVMDGMDIALCAINYKSKKLEFAGAFNPVWIARKNEMQMIKGTKQPIGNYHKTDPFERHDYQLESGDWVFLFSDGFADQFGGEKGKKFKYMQLQEKLLQFIASPEGDFETFLESEFNNWKGEYEQVDDICLLGFKIS